MGVMALLGTAYGASGHGDDVAAVQANCRQAVAQSRMVCVTGANCQKEISPILRACSRSSTASCIAAREEVLSHCRAVLPWYGSRECEEAARQVSDYCER